MGAETGAESREGAGTGRGDGVGAGKEEAWERGQEREEEGREREGIGGKEWEVTGRKGGRKGGREGGRKGAGGNPRRGEKEDTPSRHNQAIACFCARLFVSLHRRPALSLPAVGRGRKVRATQSTAQANDLISVRVWERNRKRPPARASSDAGQVRVKRRGKSPPRRQRCRPAVRPAGCKTVYTGSQGLLARCRGVGCWRRRVTAVVDK